LAGANQCGSGNNQQLPRVLLDRCPLDVLSQSARWTGTALRPIAVAIFGDDAYSIGPTLILVDLEMVCSNAPFVPLVAHEFIMPC
jgi:hypothetical protein